MASAAVVLELEDLMHLVFRYLDSRELLVSVPAVCRAWRSFLRTFAAPNLSLNLVALGYCDRIKMLNLAAAFMPSIRGLRLQGMIAGAAAHLGKFRRLRTLDISLHTVVFASTWRKLLGSSALLSELNRLVLSYADVDNMRAMAATQNLRLRHLKIIASSAWSLFSPICSAVVNLTASAPRLETLELFGQAFNDVEITLVLKQCPNLKRLVLMNWSADTDVSCISAACRHGAQLEDVTFTLEPKFSKISRIFDGDPLEFVDRDEQVYCNKIFYFFNARPRLRRIHLRNVHLALQQMIVRQHFQVCQLPTSSDSVPAVFIEHGTATFIRPI